MTQRSQPTRSSQLRILDANLNRVMEALRVLEDLARFHCESKELSTQLKTIRGRLAELFQPIYEQRVLSRNVAEDVGVSIQGVQEYERNSLLGLLAANSERAKQAMRTLEEISKTDLLVNALNHRQATLTLDAHAVPKQLESFRYRIYELEQQLYLQLNRNSKMDSRLLYVLVDASRSFDAFSKLIQTLCESGADVIQLRDKNVDDRLLVGYARKLVEITRDHETLGIINDRPDVALIANADGVHVGQSEIELDDCRYVLGQEKLVGLSTHDPEQVRAAERVDVDYIGFGPLFPSTTKRFEKTLGTSGVDEAVTKSRLPAFGIGGIDLDRLDVVFAAGLKRVAVGAAITNAESPGETTQRFKEKLLENFSVG